jgi:YVTN family beta-propeller protein
LPGGRIVAPAGEQFPTGGGPLGLAISPSGKTLATANLGPDATSITVMDRRLTWEVHHVPEGGGIESISGGVCFSGEHTILASEGNTGQIAVVDAQTGELRRVIDVNQKGYESSYAGSLALDDQHGVLYVADPANARVVTVDLRSRQILASLRVGGIPLALTLSPNRRKLFVASAGSDARQSGSVSMLDVADPVHPKVEASVPTGKDPAGILALGNRVYVANAKDDSISVIDTQSNRIEAEIPIRMEGLEQLRGILPMALAYHEKTGWLLVAEPGINAVGVIDTNTSKVIGHMPAGWLPTNVLVDRDNVYVANFRGAHGGPRGLTREGTVSVFPLPPASALPGYTSFVVRASGLASSPKSAPPTPEGIRYVVLIVKGSLSFDEVFGDVRRAANGAVMGAPSLARLGSAGFADGEHKRLSLKNVNVTPNHHALAQRWTVADNFYADSDVEAEGHRWLTGSYPIPGYPALISEPEERGTGGDIWKHLSSHGVSFLDLSRLEVQAQASDSERAARVIDEIDRKFVKTGTELPRLLYIAIPHDSPAPPQPGKGYPYAESYAADNDNALGRLVEYLSTTPWWKQMAIFVTESAPGAGFDHIDEHRIPLLCVGPWAKQNYVVHINTGFPGLLKTIFEILRVPALNLFDATAAGLRDCFAGQSDERPYRAVAVDPRIYPAAQ